MELKSHTRPHAELDFRKVLTPTVLVLSLGFMIDAFDLLLYNMVRVPSLTEMGLDGDALTKSGIFILNCQVAGTLAGGVVFGMLGDRLGRKRAVLGSILLYSLATFACAFVQSPASYALWRFITGFGLAGEIGLGLTLTAESLPAARRGLGAGVFSCAAFLGILLAGIMSVFAGWRVCYFIAGVAGLLILLARTLIFESGLFEAVKRQTARRGRLSDLFGDRTRALRFLACTFLLMPYFFVTNLLVTLSPEIGRAMGLAEPVRANIALTVSVSCALAADLGGALLSQTFRTRKKILALFMALNAAAALAYLHLPYASAFQFYAMVGLTGLTNFWVLVTMTTVEQFGTDLRATASTMALNAGRATLIASNMAFLWLKPLGIVNALTLMCCALFMLGAFSLSALPETFDRDMDFLEKETAAA